MEKDTKLNCREMGTFVIHIQGQENHTWQGNLVWAEKKETQSFRSALELIKLIDMAISNESRA